MVDEIQDMQDFLEITASDNPTGLLMQRKCKMS